MKKLKVKFTIEDKKLSMQVLEQPDEWRQLEVSTPYGTVMNCISPALDWQAHKRIFLRGSDRSMDKNIASEVLYYPLTAVCEITKLLKHLCETQPVLVDEVNLKYSLVHNGRNVMFTVLEQSGIPRGKYVWKSKDKNLMDIMSLEEPELGEDTIYLRGNTRAWDDRMCIRSFISPIEAESLFKKAEATFKAWHKHLKKATKQKVQLEIITEVK